MRKRVLQTKAALALALMMLACAPAILTGCKQQQQPESTHIFAMDTVMSISVYPTDALDETAAAQAITAAVEEVYRLDALFSPTDTRSEIYALNHASGDWVSLSPDTLALLARAQEISEQTAGALDVTTYVATKAWGFTGDAHQVPNAQTLAQLAASIDYTGLDLDKEHARARLKQDQQLDVGAVAKGYLGEVLAQQLQEAGITSALLDLGQSSIQAVGAKANGAPWRIAIQDPQGEDYLGVLQLEDLAMGTSGGYQRFFEQDGVRYWHILDPKTAAPARNGLASVTVVAPSGFLSDSLSTALFVMGQELALDYWRTHIDDAFELILVTDGGEVIITQGLETKFSLTKENKARKVTVAHA